MISYDVFLNFIFCYRDFCDRFPKGKGAFHWSAAFQYSYLTSFRTLGCDRVPRESTV